MKHTKPTQIVAQTLSDAMELGLKISATYCPTGEKVKCWDNENLTEVEMQDGTFEKVALNDLSNFTWE